MPDLGLFNFIKAEIAKGRSKEDIVAQLRASGNSPEAIETAYTAVQNNMPPSPQTPPIAKASVYPRQVLRGQRPTAVTVVCVLLSIVLVLTLVQLVGVLGIFGLVLGAGGSAPASTFALLGLGAAVSIGSQLLVFAVIYGYWMMRRWGVQLLGGVLLLSIVLNSGTIMTNPIKLFTLPFIISIVALFVGLQHMREMS